MFESPWLKNASISCERSNCKRVSSSGTNWMSSVASSGASPQYEPLRVSLMSKPLVHPANENGPPDTVGPSAHRLEYACAGSTMSSSENNAHQRRTGRANRRRDDRGGSISTDPRERYRYPVGPALSFVALKLTSDDVICRPSLHVTRFSTNVTVNGSNANALG